MSRDIVDNIVVTNQIRNPDLYMSIRNIPAYFGQVDDSENKVKLTPIKGTSKASASSLIVDIVEGYKLCQLEAGEGSIMFIDGSQVEATVKCNPILIKIIKTCTVCSYNVNEDYATVVAEFVKQLLDGLHSTLNLPLTLPSNNTTQKLIAEELNEFIKNICDENDIKYLEVVDEKKSKSTKNNKNKTLVDMAKSISKVDN